MKHIITFFLIIFLTQILQLNTTNAQLLTLDSTTHALIVQGIHQIHIEKYDAAIKTFERLIKFHPRHPIGYFYVSAVYQTIMRNYRINTFETKFDSLLNLAIQIGRKTIRKVQYDAFAYFYLGGTYGFRGLHKMRKRDWVGTLQDGWKGLSNLQRSVLIDTKLYDAYYGLGTYHYWRSAKASVLNLLPSLRKDKQRGITEILTAIHKGRYTNIEGKYTLVAIYYDMGDYQKSLSLNQKLYELFPANPSCLYMRSRIYEKLGKWRESKNTLQKLLEHLLASEYRSIGYEVECHYNIACCHYKLGEFEQALKHVKKAMDLGKKRITSKEIEGPLEDYKLIEKKAKHLYKEISHVKHLSTYTYF